MGSKKLVGVYLPVELIARLKKYIMRRYLNEEEEKNQSEVIEEALTKYLDDKEAGE